MPGGLDPIGPLGFGTWRFTTDDLAAAQGLVETALELGMNLIDTADVYGLDYNGSGFGGNEELLGKVLAQAPHLRDQMVLATKGGIMPPIPYDSSDAYLRSAVDASLGRLGVDAIDLYQIHRPDMFAHPARVAATLAELVADGKIRAIGVSNHTPAQHDALIAHLGDLPSPRASRNTRRPHWGRCGTARLISACEMASCRSPGVRSVVAVSSRAMTFRRRSLPRSTTLRHARALTGLRSVTRSCSPTHRHPSPCLAPRTRSGSVVPWRPSASPSIEPMCTGSCKTAKEFRCHEQPRGDLLVRCPV